MGVLQFCFVKDAMLQEAKELVATPRKCAGNSLKTPSLYAAAFYECEGLVISRCIKVAATPQS